MARKRTARKTKGKVWTADQILDDWIASVQSGLGPDKRLATSVVGAFRAPLLKKIQERLDEGKQNYNNDRANTKTVARAVGKFCKELTAGRDIKLGVFEKVFAACQLHHRCPGGGGAGKWCDV